MGLKLFNTLNNSLEDFRPIDKKLVRLYNCGPTVYSFAHIGNFKTFLLGDLLTRYLQFKGFNTKTVMNITDAGHLTQDDIDQGEDKMVVAALKEGKTVWEIAEFYTKAFKDELEILHILPADKYPKATDHIPEMLDMIQTLMDKGLAYEVKGDVYFDISKFPNYGKLSGNKLEDLQAGARVGVRSEKKNPGDFALWKQDPNHLMQWDSPWGRGFPGWHVECSAMSQKYLGNHFDLHTGGEDLKFPHHECEIAQSEGTTGETFVNVWLHSSFLQIDGKKMAKRDGKFLTVTDLMAKGFSARDIRYLLTSAHYRQNFNFTDDGLKGAHTALARFDALRTKLNLSDAKESAKDVLGLIQSTEEKFVQHMDEDLNISGAWGVLFDFVTAVNKLDLSSKDAKQIQTFLEKIDHVTAVIFWDDGQIELSQEDQTLLKERKEARANKNWARSDEIRDHFTAKGFVIDDNAKGTIVKRL